MHVRPQRCLAALASLALACGDNLTTGAPPALAPSTALTVVAHTDDDLLLMQPDVLETLQRNARITTVYVAASRSEGALAAYAAVVEGEASWRCGDLVIAGHTVQHCRLASAGISLVFLGASGLAAQWRTAAGVIERDALVGVIAQVMRETQPSIVRTHDVAGSHGPDDDDHLVTGALTVLAMAQTLSDAELVTYRGDAITAEPPNKLTPVFDASLVMLAHHDACETRCETCGEACTAIEQKRVDLLLRRYAIGMRTRGGGLLRIGNQCLTDTLALVSCAGGTTWLLDDAGQLRAGAQCLMANPDGTLGMTTCIGGLERRFFIDDEGHIFSGQPPPPTSGASDGFLSCLGAMTTELRLQRCNAPSAPRWEFVPTTVATTRTSMGLTATGREVRLGDLTGDGRADLCAVQAGELVCAPGSGGGTFGTVMRIDTDAAPLAIEPRSLVIGDVDNDKRADACGRDANGILCATHASGYVTERWTAAFGDTTAIASTSASLAAIDANADGVAELCGVNQSGVSCAARGAALAELLSSWPAPDAVVWPAELDADGRADWCAATDTGAVCAVAAQRELTTDPSTWSYSQAGIVEVVPATTTTVAVADIDGDGRADMCAPRDDRITCARSQGRAFGPRSTLAVLPNQATASALWLGDLDGNGRADACADTGTTIVCAVLP